MRNYTKALVSEPGKNWVFMTNLIFWPHMAIEGVLTRQKCAEKWCATLWAPGLQFSVSPNSQIFSKSWFPVIWHFKVLEMALNTFHIVQGLSRTPLSFIPRYLTNIFFHKFPANKKNLENPKSGSLTNKLKFRYLSAPGQYTWEHPVHTVRPRLTCVFLENPVTDPRHTGFLDFQILRLSILEIFFFAKYFWKRCWWDIEE